MKRVKAGTGCGLVLSLSLLAAGASANAATITVNTIGTQFILDDYLQTIVTTSSVCQSSASTAAVGAGVAVGGPCDGSVEVFPGNRVPSSFTGVGAARGSFGADGLQLGVQSSVDVTREYGGGLGLIYGVNLTSSASFTDTVTLFGGDAGTAGFLRLAFDVDGGTELGPAGGNTLSYASNRLAVNGVGRILGNTTLQYDVPIVFGQELLLNVDMQAYVVASLSVPPDTFAHANYLNTASLTLAQVLDASGSVLSSGQIVSGSGLQYQPGSTPASVPEPASFALVAVGLTIGAVRRRFVR
jgi:hypothetical protein